MNQRLRKILVLFSAFLLFVLSIHVGRKTQARVEEQLSWADVEGYINTPNPNFYEALSMWEQYEESGHRSEEEEKLFRAWRKSVEGRLMEDGTIISEEEYEAHISMRIPSPNPDDMILEEKRYDTFSGEVRNKHSRGELTVQEAGRSYSGIPNASNEGEWIRRGPFGNPEVRWSATGNGRGNYFAFDPNDSSTIYYCAAASGLWRSNNLGSNWKMLTDALPKQGAVSVAIDPSNSDIIYVTVNDRCYKSSDYGVSWVEKINGLSGGPYEYRFDPTNSQIIVAATTSGIYRTTDGADTWTLMIAGNFRNMDATTDWAVIGAVKKSSSLFFRSADGGLTWDSVAVSGENTISRNHLAFFKPHEDAIDQNPAIFIVVEAKADSASGRDTKYVGTFKSTDLGKSFSEVKNNRYNYTRYPIALKWLNDSTFSELEDGYSNLFGGYTWFTGGISMNPKNSNHILFPTTKFWSSLDGGESWRTLPSYGGSNWADQHFSAPDYTGDTLYWCNDGGLWALAYDDMYKSDVKSHVKHKNGDMATNLSSQCDISMYTKDVHISGGQDIGQVFVRRGRDSHVASADVYRGRIAPHNDSVFMTGYLMVHVLPNRDSLYKCYNNIEADRGDSRRIYGFTTSTKDTASDGSVYNSSWLVRSPKGVDAWDFGSSKNENKASAGSGTTKPAGDAKYWNRLDFSHLGITKLSAGALEQSWFDPEIAYLGDTQNKKVWVTYNWSDDSPVWELLENAPASGHYRIATSSLSPRILFVATSDRIFISRDAGKSFSELGTFPETNPKEIIVDKRVSEGAYVLTARTVYYINEQYENWIEFNRGLPLNGFNEMRIFWSDDGDDRLYVSNYGLGVWSSRLWKGDDEDKKPVADFALHGNMRSASRFNTTDTVTLFDLSGGIVESRLWTFDNGDTTFTIANETEPSLTFVSPGFYSVTLKAINSYGSSTLTKEAYIHISDDSTVLPSATIRVTKAEGVGGSSATYEASYSDAVDVVEQGFVYSVYNRNPDLNTPGRIVASSRRRSSGNFSATVNDLQNNCDYFIRAYVIDANGVHYSATDTAKLPTSLLPLLETLPSEYSVQDSGWILNARINPEGNSVTSLSLQYGEGNLFDNEVTIDPTMVSGNQWFEFEEVVRFLPRFTTFGFRLKAEINGKTYYSRVSRFSSERDLYAYWNFEFTGSVAIDASGNGRHGSMREVERVTGVQGGSALRFDDGDDKVSLNLANVNPPYTLGMWVKKEGNGFGSTETLFNGSSNYRIDLGVWNTTHQLGIVKASSWDDKSGYIAPVDEWHHFTFVGDVDSTVTLYVDGAFYKDFSRYFPLPLLSMGRDGRSIEGLMDEIKVYERAFDSVEVKELMKELQTISFDPIEDKTTDDEEFVIEASASSGLDIAYEIIQGKDIVTLSKDVLAFTGKEGEVTIVAKQVGDKQYLSAFKAQSFTVSAGVAIIESDLQLHAEDAPLVVIPSITKMDTKNVSFVIGSSISGSGTITVLDALGTVIDKQDVEIRNGGHFYWDLTNRSGRRVASGSYMILFMGEDFEGNSFQYKTQMGIYR